MYSVQYASPSENTVCLVTVLSCLDFSKHSHILAQ